MWHFGTWFSKHGGVGLTDGLDLRGLFQPMILWYTTLGVQVHEGEYIGANRFKKQFL